MLDDVVGNTCQALGRGAVRAVPHRRRRSRSTPGRAVQVDPIKPAFKPPGTKRLKLIYDGPVSNVAFNINLRRYNPEQLLPMLDDILRIEPDFTQVSFQKAVTLRRVGQGLTLVHFSAQPKPIWSHLPVVPRLIDWGKFMQPTYPKNCANVEPKSGRV